MPNTTVTVKTFFEKLPDEPPPLPEDGANGDAFPWSTLIIAGSVVLVALIAGIVFLIVNKSKKQKTVPNSVPHNAPGYRDPTTPVDPNTAQYPQGYTAPIDPNTTPDTVQ